jgi:hypothetical protein
MYSTFSSRTRRATSLGLRGMALLLLFWGVRMVMTTPTAASGGGPLVSSALVNLQHGPQGTANLSLDTTTSTLTVQVTLLGLAPNSTHPAHFHLDDCNTVGAERIQYTLQNIVADANGQGSSTTVINDVTAIPASGWYVKVHNGPGLATEEQHKHIACAAISNPDGATTVKAVFGPTADPNEHASGSSTLTINGETMTVVVDINGLVPNSTHAAHIHAGNCAAAKQILYDLSPLVADMDGHVHKVLTFNGVPSIPAYGWAINIHDTTDLSTQTGYNPILCGNVLPG